MIINDQPGQSRKTAPLAGGPDGHPSKTGMEQPESMYNQLPSEAGISWIF